VDLISIRTLSMFLIYSQDGINVYSAQSGEFELWGRMDRVSRTALPTHLFRHFCCKMYRLATMHSITDRQRTERWTDGQTDDIIMPTADHTAIRYSCVIGCGTNHTAITLLLSVAIQTHSVWRSLTVWLKTVYGELMISKTSKTIVQDHIGLTGAVRDCNAH